MLHLEEVVGNPWSVIPIKTRLYAKDCIEVVLSRRNITRLGKFEQFENLEALWLNHNKLEEIKGLDCNFRLKILALSNNRISTLEGSLSVMKFLRVLYLNNNKLRNLDKTLKQIKHLVFLESLNLFANPLAEEPEYRNRVIFAIPTLEILDRHKISRIERIKADEVVSEYMDPLKANSNTNTLHKSKPKKIFNKYSTTERELFQEAGDILKKYKQRDESELARLQRQIKEEEKSKIMPNNALIEKNFEKFYRVDSKFCKEMETNEIMRIFNAYDKGKFIYVDMTGKIPKEDLKYLFYDIKDCLEGFNIEILERKFLNIFLDFYSKCPDSVSIADIKIKFFDIINVVESNQVGLFI